MANQYVLQDRLPLECHIDQQASDFGRCRRQPGTIRVIATVHN